MIITKPNASRIDVYLLTWLRHKDLPTKLHANDISPASPE